MPKSIFLTSPVSNRAGWEKDNQLNAFKTSELDKKFSCNCGKEFEPSGFHRCACGTTWSSSIISPSEKTAGKSIKIVRPVNEHRERVLATKKETGWVRHAVDSAGVPAFVRSANEFGADLAPTVLDDSAQSRMVEEPDRGLADSINPMGTPPKQASGGWTDQKAVVNTPPSNAYKAPEVKNPAPAVPPVTPTALPNATKNPWAVPPMNQPATNQRTYDMKPEFSEDEFRLGWALASSDSPLPSRQLHASFLEGYSEFYKTADWAPGHDTLAPVFAPPDPDKNNSMSDYTDTKKKGDDVTPGMRADYAEKADHDNALGQSRSSDSLTDLSGWKTSALIEELAKRNK